MELSIAVCDDLQEERASLAGMIRACCRQRGIRFRLRLFSSGEELLSVLQRPERFHILFLDIYMPGLSGVELARRLRRIDRSCALIFATTSTDHGLESFEVEALQREKGGWVRARCVCAEGYISLVVGNSCAAPPRKRDGRYLSSKAEGRFGLGLSIVEDIARQRGGQASFSAGDGTFRASVFLPRPAPAEPAPRSVAAS